MSRSGGVVAAIDTHDAARALTGSARIEAAGRYPAGVDSADGADSGTVDRTRFFSTTASP
jgi:hypothetical protein